LSERHYSIATGSGQVGFSVSGDIRTSPIFKLSCQHPEPISSPLRSSLNHFQVYLRRQHRRQINHHPTDRDWSVGSIASFVINSMQKLSILDWKAKKRKENFEMYIEKLKSQAVAKRLLKPEEQINLERAFVLIRDMPYTRASSRDPEITIQEWRGNQP